MAEADGTCWGYFRLVAVVPARREALEGKEPMEVLRQRGYETLGGGLVGWEWDCRGMQVFGGVIEAR